MIPETNICKCLVKFGLEMYFIFIKLIVPMFFFPAFNFFNWAFVLCEND